MRIALLHYHLKPGGVTSVIRHQAEAIGSMGWESLVLAGGAPQEASDVDVRVIEGLGYDHSLSPGLSPDRISRSILEALESRWPAGPHVLHVHNPTLAKNRHLQAVLKKLQGRGMKVLCQIHDFAEDGRPGAYGEGPYLPNCHYAAINPRDHRLLLEAGLQPQGCHLLPNSVARRPATRQENHASHGVLYPIRAIRRKNIGEAVLISLYLGANLPLMITLPPNSPLDLVCHRRWKSFSHRHQLPVQFDAGRNADFDALLSRCRFVITTSITEGFGFAFLEPWAAGKALWGRLLPDICKGFSDHGVRFDWLYTRLKVPLAWLDRDKVKSTWTSAMAAAHRRFNLTYTAQALQTAWRLVSANDMMDFGLLNEHFQEMVILKVLRSMDHRKRLRQINPFLERPHPPDHAASIIASNQLAIEKYYRPGAYARRLESIYRQVMDIEIMHAPDRAVLARSFLSPLEFSLLKWGAPDG